MWVLRRDQQPAPDETGDWITELHGGMRIWSHLSSDPDEPFGWSVLAVEGSAAVIADADGTPLAVTQIGNFHFTEFQGSPRVTLRSSGREDRVVKLRVPGYLLHRR